MTAADMADHYRDEAKNNGPEPQPAIPGLETVRELEVPHPAFELPPADFHLTPPDETPETQLTLTESEER